MEPHSIANHPMTVKLTKRILMAGSVGSYLVSNCCSGWTFRSVFEEEVAPINEREAQWKRIVASGADSRSCRFFNTQHDYQVWLNHVLSNQR